MSPILLMLTIYLLMGIIATVIIVIKEPIVLYTWVMLPIIVVIFPYALYAVFSSNKSGRWI
jgi:hypothetical protein